MKKDIMYKWSQGGGFIIKYCTVSELYKLYEVPIFGGDEIHIGNFVSVKEAKGYADTLT